MTKIWHFGDAPDGIQTGEIAATLLAGGVVLMPTDTIYGLHAMALDGKAVERVSAMKGRDASRPFIVLASSVGDLGAFDVVSPPETLAALAAVWPAPLTAILPIARPLPASRGSSSLAIRIPDRPWLLALLALTGPLISTSANRSGEPAIERIADLAEDMQSLLDGIADGGRQDGRASAILDLTGDEPRFIREGDPVFTQAVRKSLWKTG